MKKTVVFIVVLLFSYQLMAQVAGVSNSKLTVLCAQTVDKHIFEFEPAFGFGYSKKMWNMDGDLVDIFASDDMSRVSSDMGLRFTFGVAEGLEIGASMPFDLSSAGWGVKYNFLTKETMDIAGVLGLNLPLGNQIINKNLKNPDETPSVAGGVVMSFGYGSKLSLDVDAQFQKYIRETFDEHSADIFLNTEVGFYAKEGIQLIGGFGFMSSLFSNNNDNVQLLYFNPGATIEFGETFIIIVNFPVDLYGKNIEKSVGMGVAITFAID